MFQIRRVLAVWLVAALFAATAHAASVTLEWQPVPEATGYRVYFSNFSGNTRSFPAKGSVVTTATTATIPTLVTEKLYFRVTAFDAIQESLFSNFAYVAFIRAPESLKFQKVEIR